MALYSKIKVAFFLLLSFHLTLFAQEDLLSVKGYLGRDELSAAFQQIEQIKSTRGGTVVIQLSSSSGEFQEVFHFAREILELRTKHDKTIFVFIQGRAVGPAGMIPFLADKLFVTPFAAWGDIPYGVKHEENWMRTKSMIKELINPSSVLAPVLQPLVDAMIDPHYQLADRKTPSEAEKLEGFDPLILNTKKMESLGIVAKVMTDEEFKQQYDLHSSVNNKNPLYRGIVTNLLTPAELEQKLQKHIPYSLVEKNLVGYLQLTQEQPIQQSTYLYFKFALEEFRKQGVRFVLLNIDSPGGEIFPSLKIVDLLQKIDVNYGIPVIAYINNWAVSAGAMIAYACRFIFVNSSSIMGAAEPVFQGKEGGMESAPEKINSALRAEFSNLARFFGRNPLLAQAMVDKDMILVIRNHEIIKLDSEEEIRIAPSNPDIVISKQDKLLTLQSKQLIDLGVADYNVKPDQNRDLIGANDQKTLFKGTAIFTQPFLKTIPRVTMVNYEDWRINFFTVLSHPIVASLLFIGLILGFYIEINTPGFGVPGSIGLACLALILLSSFSTEAINWIEIILLLGGLVLLAVELFVIPGFGVVGILGIILTIIGLFALMLPGIEKINFFHLDSFELIGPFFLKRLAWLSGALIFSILTTIFLARFFSHRFFRFSKFVLRGEQEGFSAGILRECMPEEGELGETLTPLRPSGKIRIGEKLYDAVAQTGYIQKGAAVEVVRVESSYVVVCPVDMRKK